MQRAATIKAATIAVAAAIAVVTVSAGEARAGEATLRNGRGKVDLSLFAQYLRIDDPERVGGLGHIGAIGARVRLWVGERAAYCAGFDFEAGGGDGGAPYDFDVYPIGLGVRFARTGSLGVCAGIGVGGAIGAVPVGAQIPVELDLSFDLGRLHVAAWSRARWVLGADARQSGAASLPAGDELLAGAGLRWGKRVAEMGARATNGYYLGVAYQEWMGTRAIGAVVGYGVTVGR